MRFSAIDAQWLKMRYKLSWISNYKFQEIARQIESNLKRFDKKGKGKLTVDDYYNVIKVHNRYS